MNRPRLTLYVAIPIAYLQSLLNPTPAHSSTGQQCTPVHHAHACSNLMRVFVTPMDCPLLVHSYLGGLRSPSSKMISGALMWQEELDLQRWGSFSRENQFPSLSDYRESVSHLGREKKDHRKLRMRYSIVAPLLAEIIDFCFRCTLSKQPV